MRWLVALLAACGFRAGVMDEPSSAPDASGTQRDATHVFVDAPAAPPAIMLVQKTFGNSGGADGISATFGAQTSHDFNVAVVKWDSGSTACNDVTDASGNVYAKLGTTLTDGAQQLEVWYATDIAAAGTNKVSATFGATVSNPTLRILEYSGIALASPVDTSAAASSTSASMSLDSGPAMTGHASDLLILAEASNSTEQSVGSGFHDELDVTGDVVADEIVDATGSYDATASIFPGGRWMIALAAFAGQ
ncbi:MAG TPA: hypothetical protein VMJ10_02985 [Kofleriaceae bacterium]|nr:hypothetical protein [Kofleriaceae bacterium]